MKKIYRIPTKSQIRWIFRHRQVKESSEIDRLNHQQKLKRCIDNPYLEDAGIKDVGIEVEVVKGLVNKSIEARKILIAFGGGSRPVTKALDQGSEDVIVQRQRPQESRITWLIACKLGSSKPAGYGVGGGDVNGGE
ncbi:unnamed protein product [Microthlaspi erraticum]|uniref:Uncharacterized protein n=1 Tax=Microthlaspi erraticum TaxID=1685480 RepID=A0A6D2JA53_9BRAS|nr:unnamed protein product [Microthlaspi erraticum]